MGRSLHTARVPQCGLPHVFLIAIWSMAESGVPKSPKLRVSVSKLMALHKEIRTCMAPYGNNTRFFHYSATQGAVLDSTLEFSWQPFMIFDLQLEIWANHLNENSEKF